MASSTRREWIEALFAAHAAEVHAYARRRVGGFAEDVVAETFLIAWRRRDVVPATDPLPWLYATARRVIANQLRSDTRRAALVERIAAEPTAEGQASAEETDDNERTLRALAALPSRDREALTLLAWEGLTSEQAARALGCSRPAFRVRVHRARRKLAAALERHQSADRRADDVPKLNGLEVRV